MGAGASLAALPDCIDKTACNDFCGKYFDEELYDREADSSGKITKETLKQHVEKYDAFLTHDWGAGSQNHAKVTIINNELQKRRLTTWLDAEQMSGDIVEK